MSITARLHALVSDLETEETAARKGNASAGVRARKILIAIKKAASEGREEIQALRGAVPEKE